MSSDRLSLKWKDFQSDASESFRGLRDNTDFSDVTLASEGNQQIKAHKVILAASSPFFMEILRSNKHSHPLIYMRGVKGKYLVAILDFIYNGEVNIYQEDLENVLALAEEIQLKGLMRHKEIHQENIQQNKYHNKTKKEMTSVKRNVMEIKTEDIVNSSDESSREITFWDYKGDVASALLSEERSNRSQVTINSDFDNWNEKLDSMIEKIDGMWKCKSCVKTNKNKQDARRHTETHIEGFFHSCNDCAKQFRTSNALHTHMSRVHN